MEYTQDQMDELTSFLVENKYLKKKNIKRFEALLLTNWDTLDSIGDATDGVQYVLKLCTDSDG